MAYEIKEFYRSFNGPGFVDDAEAALVKDRMNHTADAMQYMLSSTLYGDGPAYMPPSRWQRFTRYWRGFPERARDAWDVLTGRASIGDY